MPRGAKSVTTLHDVVARAAAFGAAAWLSGEGHILLLQGARADDLRAALGRPDVRAALASVGRTSLPVGPGLSLTLEWIRHEHVLAYLVDLAGVDAERLVEHEGAIHALLGG